MALGVQVVCLCVGYVLVGMFACQDYQEGVCAVPMEGKRVGSSTCDGALSVLTVASLYMSVQLSLSSSFLPPLPRSMGSSGGQVPSTLAASSISSRTLHCMRVEVSHACTCHDVTLQLHALSCPAYGMLHEVNSRPPEMQGCSETPETHSRPDPF